MRHGTLPSPEPQVVAQQPVGHVAIFLDGQQLPAFRREPVRGAPNLEPHSITSMGWKGWMGWIGWVGLVKLDIFSDRERERESKREQERERERERESKRDLFDQPMLDASLAVACEEGDPGHIA